VGPLAVGYLSTAPRVLVRRGHGNLHVPLMKAFIEGTIKLFEQNKFKDAETQQPVEYFTYFIQGDNQTIKLNSKNDYTKTIDKEAVIEVDIQPDFNTPSKFRVKLINVQAQK